MSSGHCIVPRAGHRQPPLDRQKLSPCDGGHFVAPVEPLPRVQQTHGANNDAHPSSCTHRPGHHLAGGHRPAGTGPPKPPAPSGPMRRHTTMHRSIRVVRDAIWPLATLASGSPKSAMTARWLIFAISAAVDPHPRNRGQGRNGLLHGGSRSGPCQIGPESLGGIQAACCAAPTTGRCA